MKERLAFIFCFMTVLLPLTAQDFGFGFDDEGTESVSSENRGVFTVSIGGEVAASMTGYVDDFTDGADKVRLEDIFSGKLNFSAETSRAEGVINLKLRPMIDSPVTLDEAYVRAYFGKFDIEGGLRKLTWGKADMMGPLDVINPLDYSDFSIMSEAGSDPAILKCARPLVHASYRIGSFSKIEGVFVPNFEPARFAETGRWVPAQMAQMDQLATVGIPVNHPDTTTLNYAQAGLRFTTTIGGAADVGVQYYYGRRSTPAVTMALASPSPQPTAVNFDYNPYHQIGVDWAQVLFGFNIRVELAANITGDLNGDDGAVYNPALAWSLGFDRELVWGINLNVQANESITLLHNKIADNALLDIEADSDTSATQIIASLSKKFLRDEFEARVSVLWEVEAQDFLIMPSLVWTKDAVSVELSGGIFGGDKEGQFGQYRDNGFVKVALKYTF
jgi:hypothetical protein